MMTGNYGIKDAANLTVINKSTGKVFLYTPYANTTTNEWTSSQTYANAKGSRAIRWDHDKQSTLVVNMEVFDLKWLAMLAGSNWETGAADIFKREVLVASSGKLTLAAAPKAGSLSVYKLAVDNVSHGDEQLPGTPATDEDTYSISAQELTLNAASAPDGAKFVVYYQTASAATASKISFKAEKYPESYEIIADAMIRSKETGVDEYVQMRFGNTRPIPNFTITMDAANVSSLEITFDVFADEHGDHATYTAI